MESQRHSHRDTQTETQTESQPLLSCQPQNPHHGSHGGLWGPHCSAACPGEAGGCCSLEDAAAWRMLHPGGCSAEASPSSGETPPKKSGRKAPGTSPHPGTGLGLQRRLCVCNSSTNRFTAEKLLFKLYLQYSQQYLLLYIISHAFCVH